MKKTNKNIRFLAMIAFTLIVSIFPMQKINADELLPNNSEEVLTYYPEEKVEGLVKNPAMGWTLYLDAFDQMTNDKMPDINKGVYYPELFWDAFDESGATEKASIFYIRAPWSFFEAEEGKYAWEDGNNDNYQYLIDHALENDIRLAFRVYIDSQDSFQQATPNYVKDAGAKGYVNSHWTPYVNDEVFLEKFTAFIAAFGEEYDDSDKVDFIDGMGLGHWGEGHQIRTDSGQPGNVNTALKIVTDAYQENFKHVLLGPQQGGALAGQAEKLVLSNEYDILRRDSFGMPAYFKPSDAEYYVGKLLNEGIPLFAENGWNYFAHDFEGYMKRNGSPYSNIRSMLEASLSDAIAARANTFDFRVPEDAFEWMKHGDLVDQFVNEGGYRFVPTSLSIPEKIQSNDYLIVKSQWKNTGIGKIPNDRAAWDYKYKLAYALLDPTTEEPVFTHVSDVDPSEWLKGSEYDYETNVSFGNVPDGTYEFAYAIVDTTKDNQPAINLAIKDEKTSTGWHTIGQTTVSDVENLTPKSELGYYKLSKDFGNTQGENQWSYLEGQSAPYKEMTWNEDQKTWRGSYEHNVVRPNAYLHPQNNDTVVGWKAPKIGDITLMGNPRKQNVSCGNGVNVKIMKNDEKIWPLENEWQHIPATDQQGFNHNLVLNVEEGDSLYFIINRNGSEACDGSIWDPTISYRSGLESLPEPDEDVVSLKDFASIAAVSTDMGKKDGVIENILNDTNEAWSSQSANFPGYITFDLGENLVNLEKINLLGTYAKSQGITNLDVEYHDGENWVSAISNVSLEWSTDSATREELEIEFDSVTTNKVRLKVNKGNTKWGHIAITQVKLLGYEKIVIDVEPLKEAITEAKSISNDDGRYTENTFLALQEAIEKAEGLLTQIDTEEDLQEALAELQLSVNSLAKENDLEDFAPKATASTDMGTGVGKIEYILDDTTESWTSKGRNFPGYITFDLGYTFVNLEKINLVAMYGKDQGITNLEVEYHDGENWVSATSNVSLDWLTSSATPEELEIEFDPVVTNKVRLKVNKGNTTWGHVALTQVKLLGHEKIMMDVEPLKAAITEAKAIENEDGLYTEGSFTALQDAIEKAEGLLTQIDTEEELQAAIAELQLAVANLVNLETEEEANAVKAAKEKTEWYNYSKEGLIQELEWMGFTPEESLYAVEKVNAHKTITKTPIGSEIIDHVIFIGEEVSIEYSYEYSKYDNPKWQLDDPSAARIVGSKGGDEGDLQNTIITIIGKNEGSLTLSLVDESGEVLVSKTIKVTTEEKYLEDLAEAEAAVELAEETGLQADVDAATLLVNSLRKDAQEELFTRLDSIEIIDEPTVDPEEPTVDPEKPTVDPEEPTVKPEEPTVNPDQPTVNPDQPTIKPEEPTVDVEVTTDSKDTLPATGLGANTFGYSTALTTGLAGVLIVLKNRKRNTPK